MKNIRLPYPHPGQQAIRKQAKRFNWLSAGRRWRKTTMAMSIAVENAMQKKRIIWGAPTYDQVRIGFAETRHAAAGVATFNISRMEVEFPGGGIIYYRSLDDPNNVRGYTADGVVIDECAAVKQDAYHEVLRPMLIDTGGWIWGIGTPLGRNWFWNEHMKALDDEESQTWQVPSLGVAVEDGKLIRAPHPLENPYLQFEEIERLYQTLPERVFNQEILAQFIDSSGGVFRRVMECATAQEILTAEPGRQYIAGVDVASLVDFTVVSVIDVAAKSMVYMDRFNRIDYTALGDRLEALYHRFKLDSMVIEANSIGQPVIDALSNRGMSIIPFTTTSATKQTAIQLLQSAFEHGIIKIINDPILIGELQAFEGQRTPSGGWKYAAPESMHDDCVMSLAIGWQAVEGGNLWLIS